MPLDPPAEAPGRGECCSSLTIENMKRHEVGAWDLPFGVVSPAENKPAKQSFLKEGGLFIRGTPLQMAHAVPGCLLRRGPSPSIQLILFIMSETQCHCGTARDIPPAEALGRWGWCSSSPQRA